MIKNGGCKTTILLERLYPRWFKVIGINVLETRESKN